MVLSVVRTGSRSMHVCAKTRVSEAIGPHNVRIALNFHTKYFPIGIEMNTFSEQRVNDTCAT